MEVAGIVSARVLMVLLIAAVNVANLLLVRTQERTMVMVMRAAVGASRARIAAQILVESVLLAAIGGALGVLVAVWTVDVLIGLAPASLARFDEVAVDVRLLLAGIGITAFTGIAFGLWPAWRASGTPTGTAINAAARASAGRQRRRTQQLLVFGELALALVLLAGAGLLVTSFAKFADN